MEMLPRLGMTHRLLSAGGQRPHRAFSLYPVCPIIYYGRYAYWSAGGVYDMVKHFFLKGSVPSAKAIWGLFPAHGIAYQMSI